MDDAIEPARPPTCDGARQELEQVAARHQTERQPGWEYFYFAALVEAGVHRLRPRERDHALGLPCGRYRRISDDDAVTYIRSALDELRWVMRPLHRVLSASEDAFGLPGEPGDPVLIEHLADWLLLTYERMLDWAGLVRCAGVTEAFEPALELTAELVDEPTSRVQGFLERIVQETRQAEHALSDGSFKGLIQLSFVLELVLDEMLVDKVLVALRAGVQSVESD